MNTDTKQVYWTEDEVKAAEQRGERLMPLIPVIRHEARDSRGRLLSRRERRKLARKKAKA